MKADTDRMSHPAESVEVLVIGGGVIGSSIAYHVARQGRSVLVVERNEVAVEPAASWGSAGGVTSDREWIRLRRHSPAPPSRAGPRLAEELDADLEYRQGGHLLLAENEGEAEDLQSFVQRQHELGLADVSFLDRKAVFSLVPGLGEQVTAGSFSAASGQADPRLHHARLRQRGATAWVPSTGRVPSAWPCNALLTVSLERGPGVASCRRSRPCSRPVPGAVNWPGRWASQLPLRTRVLQALRSTPAPPGVLRPVVSAVGRALSLKQHADGALLLGGGWLG